MSDTAAIDIVCQRGAGDKEAPEIVDSLITTEPVAVTRGTAFLDENDYEQHTIQMQAPHKSSVVQPELTVLIQDLNLGINERFLIEGLKGSVSMQGGKPSLLYSLDLVNYTAPE